MNSDHLLPPSDPIASGRHLRFVKRKGWEFVERNGVLGIVVVVAAPRKRFLVLVSQWREPVQAPVIELPAGLAGDIPGHENESLKTAAVRELFEETGFEASGMQPLLVGPPSAGLSGEVMTLFRALEPRRVNRGGGEPGEGVRTHVIPLARLEEWLDLMADRGFLVDPKVLAGAWYAVEPFGATP